MATWIDELVDAEHESAQNAFEAERLREVRAELLAALRKIADADHQFCLAPQDLQDIALAAIAKAEGKTE